MPSWKEYLWNLNTFEPDPDSEDREDEHQRRSNIIATRVYYVVFMLVLIILSSFLLFNQQTLIITLQNPTEDQVKTLPEDAQCPCSRISIEYGEFVSSEPYFHQVCSSDFVSDRWVEAIFPGANSTYFYDTDFRAASSAQFQALASLCRLSNVNALQSITSFAMNTLISPKVLLESDLRKQVQESIDQFQTTANKTFGTQLKIVRELIMAFNLMSGLETNYYPFYFDLSGSGYMNVYIGSRGYIYDSGTICYCGQNIDCQSSANIYNMSGPSIGIIAPDRTSFWVMQVPGISVGCIPIDSMLLSTLECFYNQTCIDELISFFPTTENFTKMTVKINNSRFAINATVKSIVDELMVEKWMRNISYEKYYAQCAPTSCTYLAKTRSNFVFVLTKIISLLGGLTVALRLIIPIVIRYIRRPRNTEPTPKIPLHIRLQRIKILLKTQLIELNIFQQNPSNDRQVRYQRYATRLYILLLIISLVILAFYSSLIRVTRQETVYNPSESQYIQLQETYPNSLSCPCTSVSISYSIFTTLQPHYHQVCSSDLISSRWLSYVVYSTFFEASMVDVQYKWHAATYFQLLSTFCQQCNETIEDAVDLFLRTQFIGGQVVPSQLFIDHIKSLIQEWQTTTINRYVRTLDLLRLFAQGNQLTDGYRNIVWNTDYNLPMPTTIKPKMYSNCSCDLSKSCRTLMYIHRLSDYTVSYVPNFYADCFAIEGLLASTLECFYNISCMKELDQGLQWPPLGDAFNFSALNATLNSPYDTINSLVNQLMVDSWSKNVSFSSYYEACAPQLCTYEVTSRNNLFIVITMIISLFGGLSLGWKLLILVTLQLIEKLKDRNPHRGLTHFIKDLFTCRDKNQMIRRLHVLFVILSLVILYSFTAFTPQVITVDVQKPSFSQYQDLATRFPTSLRCSCKQISIQYDTFLIVQPRFHQLCSSDFISNEWITYLYDEGNLTERFSPTDFRYSASSQFRSLAAFCQLSQQTTYDALSQLNKSNIIHTELLSLNRFDESIQKNTDEFRSTMPNSFISTLALIRDTTGTNMFLTALSTNWIFPASGEFILPMAEAFTEALSYEQCSCRMSSRCVQPSRGMLSGCYPIEALFQSTLQCLYDQQCIDANSTFKALNTSASTSRYSLNTTIESLVNALMIEEFRVNMSYENYFSQCAPSSCSYLYIDKSNIIDGITNLIALYGGLVIICRAMAVIVVRLFTRQPARVIPAVE